MNIEFQLVSHREQRLCPLEGHFCPLLYFTVSTVQYSNGQRSENHMEDTNTL